MTKLKALAILLVIASFTKLSGQTEQPAKKERAKEYEVAVYYFPNYHPDSINTRWHGKGWTE
ncbi:MAG: hypothetical protein H0X41_13240, partial [Chitinophagaceae bacterium]|nr:hypothetical protein [Chitinophagaceae bacterium]